MKKHNQLYPVVSHVCKLEIIDKCTIITIDGHQINESINTGYKHVITKTM